MGNAEGVFTSYFPLQELFQNSLPTILPISPWAGLSHLAKLSSTIGWEIQFFGYVYNLPKLDGDLLTKGEKWSGYYISSQQSDSAQPAYFPYTTLHLR